MSGIPSETVNYPFAGGVDQKTDPWLVAPPRLTILINATFTKNGQLRKRFGYNPLAKNLFGIGGTITAAARVGFRKSELLVVDGHHLHSYSPSLAAESQSPWVQIDQVPEMTATRASIDTGPTTAYDADSGYVALSNTAGFEVYTWTNGSGSARGDVFVTVIDTASGTTLYRSYQLTTGAIYQQPYVANVGTMLFIVYTDGASAPGNIRCRRLDLTAPTAWVAQQTLASDTAPGGFYLAYDVISQDTRIVIAYQRNTAAPNISIKWFDSTGSLGGSNVVVGEANTVFSCISLGYGETSLEHICIVYAGAFGTKNYWCNQNLAQVFGPAFISSTLAAVSAGICKYIAGTYAIVAMNMIVIGGSATALQAWSYRISLDGGANATFHLTYGYVFTSRPFLASDGRVYCAGLTSGGVNQTATTIVVDLQADQNNVQSNHRPVATIAPRISQSAIVLTRAFLSAGQTHVGQLSSSAYMTNGVLLRSNAPNALVGMTKLTMSLASSNRFQPLEIGENLHLTGGVPSYYDGRGLYEIGFLQYPDSSNIVATVATTGGTMAAGTYIYVFTYEITDAAGQRHRSATSVQKLVTVGGTTTSKVTFTQIPLLTMTTRQDNDNGGIPTVEIVIYRSLVGGTTLYRLTSEQTPVGLQSFPSAQYTTFADTQGDGVVNGNALSVYPLLYTTGGILDNVCPPSATCGCVHRGRVWLAGTDDPRVVWFSKQFVTGEAVAFCDAFTFTLEDRNPITAIASLDDKLAIFTRTSIYIVTGDGPTDSGIGNDLSTPQRVASDVGCIEPRSVVLTPDGLMFQSEEGIMLLDRSNAVSYIGSHVEDTLNALGVITSATVKPDQNQVVFTVQSAQFPQSGGILKYDYIQQSWGSDSVYDSDQGSLGAAFQSAARSPGGVFTGVTPFGQVHQERPASDGAAYLDGSNWITMQIGTAWVNFGGIQDYKRCRRAGLLANRITACGMAVSFATDYDNAVTQVETLTDSQVTAVFATPPMQPMFRISTQGGISPRCQSIQVTILDAPPSVGSVGNGQGLTFTGLAFEIARKPGLRRVGAVAKW